MLLYPSYAFGKDSRQKPENTCGGIKEYVLIDAGSHIHTNFDFIPINIRFVVIANHYLAEDITAEQRKRIDQIVVLPKLDLESVLIAVKIMLRIIQMPA